MTTALFINEWLIGKTFVWDTGTYGKCTGFADDKGSVGNLRDRCMLLFKAPDGGVFCYKYTLFMANYTPGVPAEFVEGGFDWSAKIYDVVSGNRKKRT